MMARRTRKLWVGIGAASMVGIAGTATGVTVANAQHAGKHGASQVSGASEAGTGGALASAQGGEAYLTDGGPKDTRIRIYRDIALMRGHLLVGGELIEQNLWDEALPHFLHPTEELYGLMERYIKLHKVTPFDRQLKAQGQAVKAKSKTAYAQAAKTVDARLSNALESFKRFMQGDPFTSYTARTVVEVLKVAKSEYEAAIEDGRFAKPVEYQDSRGFVLYSERLLDMHAKDFEKLDAAKFAELRGIIADLKQAWPAAVPPERPVIDVSAVAAKVDAFETAAKRFF